ncbi:MAG: hypothetical protein L0Y61_03515 [Epsilonproteobacteria bacterium]|nr:hypothetical protein [Campylobacterota bacterium]
MIHKIQSFFTNPNVQNSLHSMKPEKSLLGFIGIVFFFIVPEIVGFTYGTEIIQYAKLGLEINTGFLTYYYDLLIMLFEEGGSWFNLALGVGLLVWLFKSDNS